MFFGMHGRKFDQDQVLQIQLSSRKTRIHFTCTSLCVAFSRSEGLSVTDQVSCQLWGDRNMLATKQTTKINPKHGQMQFVSRPPVAARW